MITRDNLKAYFEGLDEEMINSALDSKSDYLACELCFFNSGVVSYVSAENYDEVMEEELTSNGNLFIDKDDFLRLYVECGANNAAIDEYL